MKTMHDDALIEKVCVLFQMANERVIIISAFVGAETLERLLESVPNSVAETTIYARWRMEDIASGASDWNAWNVARKHGKAMYACEALHAKIYIADDDALVGSANATASGLNLDGNLEILIPVKANHPDVAQMLHAVKGASCLAAPMGADIRYVAENCSQFETLGVPIWLPKVSPDAFLDAIAGKSPHTEATLAICKVFSMPENGGCIKDLTEALRTTTVFQLVREAFRERIKPMDVGQMKTLLSEQIDPIVGRMPEDQINILVQWLGRFGENIHLTPHSEGSSPSLSKGRLLETFEVKHKEN